jgi:hypothetical protein
MPAYHSFSLTQLEGPPSLATIDLLKMPVTRKDNGETVLLGNFLVSVTAAELITDGGTPAVGIVAWGEGNNPDTFQACIDAVKQLKLFESNWNPEGLIYEWGSKNYISLITAIPTCLATKDTFVERNPKIKGVLEAWLNHIVEPVAKNDPASLMIIGVANQQELAAQIVCETQEKMLHNFKN